MGLILGRIDSSGRIRALRTARVATCCRNDAAHSDKSVISTAVGSRGSSGAIDREAAVTSSRAAANAATHRRISSSECAADSCTRMRAAPRGTTGKLNAVTYTPFA